VASISAFVIGPRLVVVERYAISEALQVPPKDDSMTNPDYKLLPYHWHTTAKYYINPSNKYGFSKDAVVAVINAAASAWDNNTKFQVFRYMGTTSRTAGKYDGYNVISWGTYRAGVLAVTYIWYIGDRVVETDTLLNSYYAWSLKGEARKVDLQDVMTHEFGHWCGLADLYSDADYWLTMFGYSSYGETYKRTLGLGDILGLREVCGS